MADYTIWTLNRASMLVEGREREICQCIEGHWLERQLGRSPTCEMGVRVNPPDDPVPTHQLMFEGTETDEYFLPIPLKCIGSKYQDGAHLDDSARAILNGIVKTYSYFDPENRCEFERFWDKTDCGDVNQQIRERFLQKACKITESSEADIDPFGEVKMTTPEFKGYYELLEEYSKSHGNTQHILIGYSQGGLVARYLAFLDEYVFKKNIIAAVITIASPNYGSPLGNPNNQDSVICGLNEILLTLLSLDKKNLPNLHDHAKLSYDFVCDTIGIAYVDSTKNVHQIRDLLKTSIKWLSGLDSNPNSAFDALEIQNIAYPYSVLNLIHQYPLQRVYAGAVIITNNNPNQLLLSNFVRGNFATSLIGKLLVQVTRRFHLWGRSLHQNIDDVGEVYRETVMQESVPNVTQSPGPEQMHSLLSTEDIVKTYKQLIAASANLTNPMAQHGAKTMFDTIYKYRKGCKISDYAGRTKEIPPDAHDFIIPSVYQRLPEGDRLLGICVNELANHNSGKSRKYVGGRKNYDSMKHLLKILRKRLKSEEQV